MQTCYHENLILKVQVVYDINMLKSMNLIIIIENNLIKIYFYNNKTLSPHFLKKKS